MVGSSRNSTCGLCSREAINSIFIRSPRESSRTTDIELFFDREQLGHFGHRAFKDVRRECRKFLRSTPAIRARADPTRAGSFGRAAARTGGDSRLRAPRAYNQGPAPNRRWDTTSPESIFRVVVFPAPLGPRKPTNSPGLDFEADIFDRDSLFVFAMKNPRTAPQNPGAFL